MSFFNRKNTVTMLIYVLFQITISSIYVNPVDVLIHYFTAVDISNGILLYRDLVQHLMPNGSLLPYPSYPPLYLGFLGFLFSILGESMALLKFQLILDNCITAWLSYELSLRLFTENEKIDSGKIAYIAMILYMINPVNLNAVFSGFFDNFVLMLTLASLIAFLDNNYIISGFSLSLAVFSKQFPLILLLPFIAFFYRKKLRKEGFYFCLSFLLTSFVISLPFLICCPERYLYEITGFHLVDVRPSFSIFYYFLSDFESLSFILQLFSLFIICLIMITWFEDNNESKNNSILLWAFHLSFLSFLFFNRISYPHYLPYITISLPFILISIYHNIENIRSILIIASSYILTALFALAYSLVWIFDTNSMDYKNLLEYWVFAFGYNFFFLVYLIYSFYLFRKLHNSENLKTHNLIEIV